MDSAILRVPAGRVLRTDERGLPVGSLAVAGTDDDFTRADGSRDKLIGIIEKRFGDAKEKINEKLNETHISDKLH